MKREKGFYWCFAEFQWLVCYWDGYYWDIPRWIDHPWQDSDLKEIIETKLVAPPVETIHLSQSQETIKRGF